MTKLKRLKSSKGKRWSKGQSSSSNPDVKTHREAAKRGFFRPAGTSTGLGQSKGKSLLTKESLHKHNAAVGAEDRMDDDDQLSIGEESAAETFATNYTNCTNASFSRLLKGFQPDSALHKEMLAILAAVAEVIKSNGGKETETEYFGALMTTLESAQTEESIGAVLSLLNMCIKRVPAAILKLKFGDISKSLVTVLERFADSDNNVLLKSTLGCLSVLLRAQEPVAWTNASTVRVFDIILSFTMHSKPKIRKAAQHSVCSVLRGSTIVASGQKPTSLHPIAGHTGKWFQEEIVRRKEEKGPAFLHLLGLLKDVIGVLPQSQVQDLVQKMLTVNFLGDALTATCAMQVLHGMLTSQPKQESLPAELNAKIVSALYNCKPELNDVQRLLAWLAVVTEAVINLGRLDSLFCVNHLPRYFAEITQLYLSSRDEVLVVVTQALQNVLSGPLSLAVGAANATGSIDALKKGLEKVVSSVESCLELQFIKAWKFVVTLITTLIDAVGQIHPTSLTSLLQSMADLRASPHFSHTAECDYAFGRAVRVLGPKAVLDAVPLQISGKEESYEFPRSWLLPILRENVSYTELAYFQKNLLPVANNCRIRAKLCEKLKDPVGVKSYDLIQRQIWSTLPGFCDSPTDLAATFKDLAPVIGNTMVERPDVRLDCMAALRNLISTCKKPADRAELARFAPNYLPRLFNLYTKKPDGQTTEGHRAAAYETISLYATVTQEEKLRGFNEKLLEKLESAAKGSSEEDPVFLLHSLVDLEQILIAYQDTAAIQKMYAACVQWLSATPRDVQLEKRAFRIFDVLLSAETAGCRKFVQEKAEDILNVLTQTLPKGTPPSVVAVRLKCIGRIVQRLDPSAQDVFSMALQEALLNLKSSGEKARTAAFALVAEIGKALQRWAEGDEEKALRDFLQILLPGLAASTQQVIATLHALSYLVHEFSGNFPQDLIALLSENCSLLMQSPTREIAQPALGLAKTITASYGLKQLAPVLKFFITGMSKMTEDCRRVYRAKTRELLERLIRKCGPELIAPILPADDEGLQKRFHLLRKEQARKKRKKESERRESRGSKSEEEDFVPHTRAKTIEEILAEEESDLEDGKEEKVPKKAGRRKETAATWIAEESDNIVDFLDPSAVQKVTVTKPTDPTQQKKEPFKTTADGKLLIVDDDDDKSGSESDESDEEGPKKSLNKAKSVKSFRSTSTLDVAQAASALAAMNVGKKRRADSSEDLSVTSEMKYKAGGSGIHRPFEKIPPKRQKTTTEEKKPKGKGDIKKGKYDPYAYVPLHKGALNKRKKSKFAGQFKSIVTSAKKGAKTGRKKSSEMRKT